MPHCLRSNLPGRGGRNNHKLPPTTMRASICRTGASGLHPASGFNRQSAARRLKYKSKRLASLQDVLTFATCPRPPWAGRAGVYLRGAPRAECKTRCLINPGARTRPGRALLQEVGDVLFPTKRPAGAIAEMECSSGRRGGRHPVPGGTAAFHHGKPAGPRHLCPVAGGRGEGAGCQEERLPGDRE